ncbi:MAG TPA: hypothetical protein ENI71_00650, partial [Chromatiales bacterium]|nr:hypothetical protein [Chromatiales bacterium]
MMMHQKTHDDRRTWILRPRTLAVAVAIAVTGGLAGCNSNSVTSSSSSATSSTASQPFLYATYAGTAGYKVARVDLSTLNVVAFAQTGSNAGGGSHKNYYYDGPV